MKSECTEQQKRIPALLLGDLGEKEKRELEAHLDACPLCRSEREVYARTMQQLVSTSDEPVPHHFFVYPGTQPLNPWQLFRGMQPRWQAAATCVLGLILLLGAAAASRLQVRSNPGGWAISFGRNDIDPATLKKDILEAVARKDQESKAAFIQEVRSEIARSNTNFTEQQQLQLTSALALLDSRIAQRVTSSEGRMRNDTQKTISDMYGMIAQQRARDLEAINLRFDSTDASNAIKARQTNEILGTLLQVADLKLR